ncbi:MAG: caspase family protein [Verrucomicrobiales bacterium]|nr:caspase family protein [Verrucomicrobiales bacterium]
MKPLLPCLRVRLLAALISVGPGLPPVLEAATIDSDRVLTADDRSLEGQEIVVRNARWTVAGSHSFARLQLIEGAVLTHPSAPNGESDHVLRLTVTGDASVDATSRIDVTARGYSNGVPTGVGRLVEWAASGGGHGGEGGRSVTGAKGGEAYGSISAPDAFGSQGGAPTGDTGGAGGGVIRLVVSGRLTVDGGIVADGETTFHNNAGGGAGGSVFATVGSLSGNGVISANGGSGEWVDGGGGAGGRIAILYGSNTFTGRISAVGGNGQERGGAGTVYTKANTENTGRLLVDNGDTLGGHTPIVSSEPFRMTIGGKAQVFPKDTLTLQQLEVRTNGILTHPTGLQRCEVSVLGDADVLAGGSISVDGRGFPGGTDLGPGGGTRVEWSGSGGGHGAEGGRGITGGLGGGHYGSVTEPLTLGSAGGDGDGGIGGAGGGAIRLTVNGRLTVIGRISAEGSSTVRNNSGGGAGGSVYLTVGTLAGSGLITANGGAGEWVDGGGGAGGRVAIHQTANSFTGAITAYGGGGHERGGAGTVYTRSTVDAVGWVLIDNGDILGAHTPFNSPEPLRLAIGGKAQVYPVGALALRQLEVRTNGILTHPTGILRCEVHVLGDAAVLPGGSISVDGRGFPWGTELGPGAGSRLEWSGSGGGHGGEGGRGVTGPLGGGQYGSITEPSALGSVGGAGDGGIGGAGGGAVRLIVDGQLSVQGRISAEGAATLRNNAGGGAGGSLFLTAGSLTGTGVISANGGAGEWVDGGGGAGGRISIQYGGSTFSGTLSAFGGGGAERGGAGTVYTRPLTDNLAWVVVDNGDVLGAHTPLRWPDPLRLAIGGKAQVYPQGALTLQELDVRTNGILTHPTNVLRCEVVVLGNARVQEGGRISTDGRGLAWGTDLGPGAGNQLDWSGSGAGHGGEGGRGVTGPIGGESYGSITDPVSLGSQGGSGDGGAGGAGGGAIRLTVNGTLTVDGRISSEGAATLRNNSGGGSGGSILLSVGFLSGRGVISVNGGAGEWVDGGGGGGGRLAIHQGGSTFVGNVTAFGGGGHQRGGAGTFYWRSVTNGLAWVVVDNGDTLGGHTPITWSEPLRLAIAGKAQVYPQGLLTLQQLEVRTNGILTHPTGAERCEVVVLGDANVLPGGSISVDGRGYPIGADPGPGTGSRVDWSGSGAGHGGAGGGGRTSPQGGEPYGSMLEPSTLGSQGASGDGGAGGAGGGSVRLIVGGNLTVDGQISANGMSAIANNAGGGSGGSLLIGAHQLSGRGAITALGGAGEWVDGGGGAGGRIAIYRSSSSFTGALAVTGGGGFAKGADGTIRQDDAQRLIWLAPSDPWASGSISLEVALFSGGAGPHTVEFNAERDGQVLPIARLTTSVIAKTTWDTTQVPDGTYGLTASVRDAAGRRVGESRRAISVNNTVLWRGGRLAASETWTAGSVYAVRRDLVIPTGVTLTFEPGVIVKFMPGVRLFVQSGGTLRAEASANQPVQLTSFLDDAVGGDSNLDGATTRPAAGSWRLHQDAGGTLALSETTRLRYHTREYGGTLTANETWTAEALREITQTVVVAAGVTLRVEAGTVLKIAPGQGLDVRPGASLEVLGTYAEPVVITSMADDAYGGDSNADGSHTLPMAGDWRSLRFDDGAQGNLNHAVIRFGGNSVGNPWGAGGAMEALGGPLTVRNSVITDALKDGAFCYGTTLFENCLVLRCDRGLTAVGEMSVIHCTIDACRIGLLEHAGQLIVRNTIVSQSIDAGIEHDLGPATPIVSSCNVWNPAARRGNYSGTADLTGQNGNISAEPRFKDYASDNLRLNYASPGIDAAAGDFATPTDLAGSARYDDPRTGNTGTPAANGSVPDMGAFEFVESAPSNIDLVVSSVQGPPEIEAGQAVQLEWTITNRGTEPLGGPWHDAIYLKQIDGGDRVFVAEPLVGRGVVVGPGESRRITADVRVPGGLVGDYQWAVDGNSRDDLVEGANSENNAALATGSTGLTVPVIALGAAPLTATFDAPDQPHWFQCRAPVGRSVRFLLDLRASTGITELYVGNGFVPTPEHFTARQREFATPDTSVVVSDSATPPADGTNVFYVLCLGRVLNAPPEPFELRAELAGLQIESVRPETVGNAGLVTLEVRGSGLTDQTGLTVRLGDTERPAIRVSAREGGRVFATFDLSGFPTGRPSVRAEEDGFAATLPEAVEVVGGGIGDFYTELNGPSVTRAGRLTTWFVTYGNRGLVDIKLPLLRFAAPGATEIRLFDLVDNFADSFTFVGFHPEILLPTLGPGQEVTFEVQVKFAAPTQVEVQMLTGDAFAGDSTPFQWNTLPAPLEVRPEKWAEWLGGLTERFGATVADHAARLSTVLDELRTSPLTYSYLANIDGRWLFGDEPEGVVQSRPIIELSPAEEAEANASAAALHLLPTRPPADGIRKTWWVVISIEDYSNRRAEGGGGGDLGGTRMDAYDMATFIRNDLGVPAAQYRGGHDSPTDAAGWTRSNMMDELRRFRGQVDADDNLVVVYSGHGGRGSAGTGYLCPNGGGSISPTAFTRAIDEVGAGTTYFINDSCHSEAFNDLVRPSTTKFVGFAATQSDKISWDTASGGELIKNFKAQMRKGRSLQGAFDITEYVVSRRYEKKDLNRHRQHPVLSNRQGVSLAGNPWLDPAGVEQERRRRLNPLPGASVASGNVGIVGSVDPNDKYALAGVGSQRWVQPDQVLPFEVVFENKTNAAAPAQEVLVLDDLDPKLDWSTLELKDIAFNDAKISVPPGLQRFSTITRVGTDTNEVVIDVDFDPGSGRITWLIHSRDSQTGELPEDPYAGFLPPNDASHRGEGSLSYTIRPKAGLPGGSQLTNLATIIFDPTYGANPPIVTPWVTNTIDALAPSSAVQALDAQVTGEFTLKWSGADAAGGSGLASYDIFVSRDNGPFSLWQIATTNTSATLLGQPGSTYRFFSIARDAAGLTEKPPAQPDAVTTIAGGSNFATWAMTQGLPLNASGPDDDPDGDGLKNFTEYALALHPLVQDALLASPKPAVMLIGGQRYVSLTYRRPKTEPGDVRYLVTASGTVAPWAGSSAVEVVGTPVDRGSFVEVTIRLRDPVEARVQGYLRVQIAR